jgi:voltage-gated potassium channel
MIQHFFGLRFITFMPKVQESKETKKLDRERYRLLKKLDHILEPPMMLLGIVWLVLLVIELIWGLNDSLNAVVNTIWGIFILDFIVKFILAPRKVSYLKKNVLTIISLIVPALRLARFAQVLRFTRGVRFVKVIASMNRGLQSISSTMQRRAVGYVVLVTAMVVFTGAAGMYALEKDAPGFGNYWDSLWYTAMLTTSIGSQYWPLSAEGRLLSFVLALYGLGILGYVSATLASLFIGQDAQNKKAPVAGAQQLEELHKEIRSLREELKDRRGASQ